MTKAYDLAVVIGRMEPPHLDHIELMSNAYTYADNLLVIVGSSHQAPNPKNPFSFQERRAILETAIPKTVGYQFQGVSYSVVPLADCNLRGDNAWYQDVSDIINANLYRLGYANIGNDMNVAIVGNDKDASSYYIRGLEAYMNSSSSDTHVSTKVISTAITSRDGTVINATDIRDLLFTGKLIYTKSVLPPETYNFLLEYSKTEAYDRMVEEYNYYKDYPTKWGHGPFFTADAVLYHQGSILLIRRKNLPGAGLYAIPGGFVDDTDGGREHTAIRELLEETSITFDNVPARPEDFTVMNAFPVNTPGRSLRGPVFSTIVMLCPNEKVFHSKMEVTHADETSEVLLMPATTDALIGLRGQLFEDHYEILEMVISNLITGLHI